MTLAEQWRAARVATAGLHLDSAACSRQSNTVIDAAATHARHEAEVGGYVAAEAATPVLDAGRDAVRVLAGLTPELLASVQTVSAPTIDGTTLLTKARVAAAGDDRADRGVVARLGIYSEARGSVHSGHSPQFRLDEDAIPTGIAIFHPRFMSWS